MTLQAFSREIVLAWFSLVSLGGKTKEARP